MKGYPVAQKYEHVYIRMRLDDNFKFFQDMGRGMREKAATKIQKWWRTRRERLKRKIKKKKKAAEAESAVKGYIKGTKVVDKDKRSYRGPATTSKPAAAPASQATQAASGGGHTRRKTQSHIPGSGPSGRQAHGRPASKKSDQKLPASERTPSDATMRAGSKQSVPGRASVHGGADQKGRASEANKHLRAGK